MLLLFDCSSSEPGGVITHIDGILAVFIAVLERIRSILSQPSRSLDSEYSNSEHDLAVHAGLDADSTGDDDVL